MNKWKVKLQSKIPQPRVGLKFMYEGQLHTIIKIEDGRYITDMSSGIISWWSDHVKRGDFKIIN